jgi:hypothetical protein
LPFLGFLEHFILVLNVPRVVGKVYARGSRLSTSFQLRGWLILPLLAKGLHKAEELGR